LEMNVRDDKKLVEIWLTNAEKIDPVLREGLKEIYAKYKTKKYMVAVFESGKGDLYENTRDLQPPPQRRKGGAAGEKAASRGHGALNDGRREKIPSAFFFLDLQRASVSCTILSKIINLCEDTSVICPLRQKRRGVNW
jgi:hypothetical protein